MTFAVVGLRVKTGKALAVAVTGTRAAPHALIRQEVQLADPDVPDTAYPFHLELEGQPDAATAAAQQARQIGSIALQRLFVTIEQQQRLKAVVVVVNSHTPPERISSPHMRAHSREGWLFREICEHASERHGIEPLTLSSAEIPSTEHATKQALAALGAEFGKPWTADWKLAATAAWLQLR
jgi:hypothetical protein